MKEVLPPAVQQVLPFIAQRFFKRHHVNLKWDDADESIRRNHTEIVECIIEDALQCLQATDALEPITNDLMYFYTDGVSMTDAMLAKLNMKEGRIR